MKKETDNDLDRAMEQGQAQYESIRDLVAQLREDDSARSREAIQEDALSVQLRSGWYNPGNDAGSPDEFEILLCTGGPAARLSGTLNDHGQPETVTMQVQDWFQPWTDFVPETGNDDKDVLLTYTRCFYFGA
jgi:hypothetical protein